MKKKLAIVCQRYGLEVNGGSELFTRQIAEQLNSLYEVEVFTTCALDYVTWENKYPPGTEEINGLKVHRFLVDQQRDNSAFNALSRKIYGTGGQHSELEEKWVDLQGPYAPKLIDALQQRQDEYCAVVFVTYLYYTTARGITAGIRNAVLIPTAHDEPPIHLSYYSKVFHAAKAMIFLTPEERAFVERKFSDIHVPAVTAGVGVELPDMGKLPSAMERFQLENYIVYVGRIDESKGCKKLFDYFVEYKKRTAQNDLKLVLLGKAVMEIPKHKDIVSLGFVSDEDKYTVMRDARCLVLASEFESLSMVVLESMALGRPVLVNGKCAVLKGHCTKSNAGLYFNNYFEFAGALNYLQGHETEYKMMQINAVDYVNEHYRWDVIVQRIQGVLEQK